ncbi:MAG: hypothetical protein Q7J98_11055 [Kiritimatiellia bacterium]|nr:hypothetical protein [Kiritimatiellia bacterium]
MKRNFFPHSVIGHLLFWLAVVAAAMVGPTIASGFYWNALLYAFAALFNYSLFYFMFNEKENDNLINEYTVVISRIATISAQLNELSKFLARERQKVENAEATVRKLNEERSVLEPVIETQRETVEAILSIHAKRAAKNAWKERLAGFGIGIFASLLASFVYEFFKR